MEGVGKFWGGKRLLCRRGKSAGLRVRRLGFCLQKACVTSDKLLHLSEPPFLKGFLKTHAKSQHHFPLGF